jgi:hypothetical protein
MNKHYLFTKMKSPGVAYALWLFLGLHYAYLGQWKLQAAYWFTLGGFGIWAIADLILIPKRVSNHNRSISNQIYKIEQREKDESYARNMEVIKSSINVVLKEKFTHARANPLVKNMN